MDLRLPLQDLKSRNWPRDPWFYAVLALGPTAWLLPEPALQIALWRLALLALVEEALFRGVLQQWLSQRAIFARRFGPLTLANLTASSCFALAHLATQPPLWAVGVFFPSLVFGWLWDRHGRLLPCALVHFSYNLWFFYRL